MCIRILQLNNSNQVKSKFVIHGCETTDSNLIASGLNEFFANVGKNLAASFNTSVSANDWMNYLGKPSPITFCFEPVPLWCNH